MSTTRKYADEETSSNGYAVRFAGETGKWFLEVQGTLVRDFALHCFKKGAGALDVGGGHGQLIRPLRDAGYRVSVLGSSEACLARIKPEVESGEVEFLSSDLLKSPYKDRSFQLVTSIRLLTHCDDWKALVAELCRVSDRAVVVDYPPLLSFNFLYPLLFELKKKVEQNTRTFTVFSHSEVVAEFVKHGFYLKAKCGQFFFPMVVYRALKNRMAGEAIEGLCRWSGLTRFFGSPTMALFERR